MWHPDWQRQCRCGLKHRTAKDRGNPSVLTKDLKVHSSGDWYTLNKPDRSV
jgi:hypothetical protein